MVDFRAIIVGASSYRLAQLRPSVRFWNAAFTFHLYLRWTLRAEADDVLWLFDSPLPAGEQLEHIREWLAGAPESTTLVVYHVGHGDYFGGRELNFIVRDTRSSATALRVQELGKILKSHAPRRKIVCIFDCWFDALLANPPTPDISGVAVLAASSRDDVAHAPPDTAYPRFSGCLLETLAFGIRSPHRSLSLADLGHHVAALIAQRFGDDAARPQLHVPRQDRGDLLADAFWPNPACTQADPAVAQRRDRSRQILAVGRERWLEQGCPERRLLGSDVVVELLTHLDLRALTLEELQFLDLSVAAYIASDGVQRDLPLAFIRQPIAGQDTAVRISRLLGSRHPKIRIGAIRLIAKLASAALGQDLMRQLGAERDAAARREAVITLRALELAPDPATARSLLQGRPEWTTVAWAMRSLADTRTALLLGDLSEFASELGTLVTSAGFYVVDRSEYNPLLDRSFDGHVLDVFDLVVVVRGENYSRLGVDSSYAALERYVNSGGVMLATPWMVWEMSDKSASGMLPFRRVSNTHNEDVSLTAIPTATALGTELFPETMTFHASFEHLRPSAGAVVALETKDGVPLYGFKTLGRGECHYLNVCQHHCTRPMQSPLSHDGFSRAIGRVLQRLHYRAPRARSPRVEPGGPI